MLVQIWPSSAMVTGWTAWSHTATPAMSSSTGGAENASSVVSSSSFANALAVEMLDALVALVAFVVLVTFAVDVSFVTLDPFVKLIGGGKEGGGCGDGGRDGGSSGGGKAGGGGGESGGGGIIQPSSTMSIGGVTHRNSVPSSLMYCTSPHTDSVPKRHFATWREVAIWCEVAPLQG